jgi:hypothetical protein
MIEINIPAVIKVKLGAGHSVKSHIECDAAGQPLVMYPKPGSIINFELSIRAGSCDGHCR